MVVSMVPAAPLLPAMLPARPAVAHGDVPELVVVGDVEPVGELEVVLAGAPVVGVGDEVVVGEDDVDEQAANAAPHSKPPTIRALRHMLIPKSSLSLADGGG
jgi:hypothetical protein